jgi:hypothetical protein
MNNADDDDYDSMCLSEQFAWDALARALGRGFEFGESLPLKSQGGDGGLHETQAWHPGHPGPALTDMKIWMTATGDALRFEDENTGEVIDLRDLRVLLDPEAKEKAMAIALERRVRNRKRFVMGQRDGLEFRVTHTRPEFIPHGLVPAGYVDVILGAVRDVEHAQFLLSCRE